MTASAWVPILCYHDITPRSALAHATPYAVAEDQFIAQMRLLHKLGYRTISVHQAAQYIREARRAPADAIVITFDDGYESLVTKALPVLASIGYTATAYLIADYVEDPAAAGRAGTPGTYLDVDGARALQSAGWEIGSHTCSHPDLTTVAGTRLEHEIATSRRRLAALFDDPITTFCYPYHRRNTLVEAQVAAAGYHAACGGYNPHNPLLNLSRINGALYGPRALAMRCTRWYWRARTNPALRSLKGALPRRTRA